jgi:DNA replication protein DnaD
MEGWLKLHRKIVSDPMWLTEKFNKAQAWIDLLILAGHKENTVKIKGHLIVLKPGQLCYSMKSLAHRWKWHRSTVLNYLNELKSGNKVYIQISRVTTIITIVNWKKYQAGVQGSVQQSVHKQEDKNTEIRRIPKFQIC